MYNVLKDSKKGCRSVGVLLKARAINSSKTNLGGGGVVVVVGAMMLD